MNYTLICIQEAVEQLPVSLQNHSSFPQLLIAANVSLLNPSLSIALNRRTFPPVSYVSSSGAAYLQWVVHAEVQRLSFLVLIVSSSKRRFQLQTFLQIWPSPLLQNNSATQLLSAQSCFFSSLTGVLPKSLPANFLLTNLYFRPSFSGELT